VGRALTAFILTMLALLILAEGEIDGSLDFPIGTPSQFGVVASTTFTIAGLLVAHRALAIRNGWVAVVALVLLGPGAAWSWLAFVGDGPPWPWADSFAVLAASGTATVLIVKGFRKTHWLEVFAGLGSLALGMVAATVHLDPTAVGAASLGLLAAVAGMTCLYGVLVDLELSEHRSLNELLESRQRIEDEVSRVEDLLHDLRSGLLAIEAAIGSFDDDIAAPLQAEAARLRRLTLSGARTIELFDLADRVRKLVAARQAAGVPITVTAPAEADTWGEESEVLAIVDNLLSNAERHGRAGPILVEITPGESETRLSVSSEGELPSGDPEEIFRRGVTTHPAGRGLGLARSRMLASVNGAELRVSPAPAGYTTFVLSLQSRPPAAVA
jgi:signal transduction histidine kinase